jgi:hypothetical protein
MAALASARALYLNSPEIAVIVCVDEKPSFRRCSVHRGTRACPLASP